jgi:catechol 2,3-dioxygenase-like lactoylglutathione lyase family enzyme
MIGYVTVGTNDLEKAVAYYDALFGSVGIGRIMEQPDYFIVWGESLQVTSLSVTKPFDGKPATAGNGNMVAFVFQTPEQVQAFHGKALELGGSNEGDPGFRPAEATSGFYAGYFRDPEGNKFNAFCIVA